MNILEFIRRNSLLVLIVIVGVGVGLLVMDYSGKSSAFSRDYFVKVNGVNYDQVETVSSGENGREFLASLIRSTRQLFDRFDTNGDERFDEQELAALQAWEQAHPEVSASFEQLNSIYSSWCMGLAHEDAVNVAIVRNMLHTTADALGLHPSEEQIDTYLRNMPAFCMPDGSFNTELYQRLAGYRRGTPNRVQEEHFRGVVADIMIWEALQSLLGSGVNFNTPAQMAQLDAFTQKVNGRTAWLPAAKVPPPAEPTEDELKAYWEEHKDAYKSPERRIVSVYTLTPGPESNMENLSYTTEAIIQDLAQANGQGLDKILADAAQNAEYDPFTYLQEDGSTHQSFPLLTQAQLSEALQGSVMYEGQETPIAQVAFTEIADAPTAQAYQAAAAAGNAEQNLTIRQIRGFYNTNDGNKQILIRIEGVESPSVLSYEEARDRALADLRSVRAMNAMSTLAENLYSEMQKTVAEQGLDTAFALATESGAEVKEYGPVGLSRNLMDDPLPSGVTETDILSTPSGKLAPLSIQHDGVRITSIERRTVEESPAISMRKQMFELPAENLRLRRSMMQEWVISGYRLYNVQLSEHVRLRGSN